MISLKNVNKYFFRHKKNEIHVINDTSLEFEKTGLVALLGPSGCGKTTLLNVIGGLDKINSGTIYINGTKMPKRGSSKKDELRVLNIGYIFQDYNLLDNLSVFDNVAISLKMIGIKNKSLIKKRVDYILEAVGMYRYRSKPAGNLSGGQRQRVGIARALIKNPDVIIADEPTGNLDSKNTLEIMNIIKSISKNKLVILVTHEKDLASFYASRIVSLEDGKIIKDEKNEHENELDYRLDNKMYLKDFDNLDSSKGVNHAIDVYSDKKDKVNLTLVVKNGVIYIQSKDDYKIEVVDENSNIEFINDNYKKISKSDYEKNDFDLELLDNSNEKIHYSSIYNVLSMIKTGFKKVASYTVMKKMLLIGFFVSAMFVVYGISSIFGVTKIRDEDFIDVNPNYLFIENNKNSIEEFSKLESLDYISYVIPGTSKVYFDLVSDSLWQLKDTHIKLSGSIVDYNSLNESDILYGRLPKEKNEIVIDELVVTRSKKENYSLGMINLNELEDYKDVNLQSGDLTFTIVGITALKNPSIYMDKTLFINVLSTSQSDDYAMPNDKTLYDYELAKNDIKIAKGNAPLNDYEVIVPLRDENTLPLNKTIDQKVGDTKLKVVGYYESKYYNNNYYVNSNTYKFAAVVDHAGMMIYSKDKDTTLKKLQESGYNARDSYEVAKKAYIKEAEDNILGSLVIAGILLAISFVEIFLMIRASFLSRIKEVGIYRAIGVKKSDIYKMFLGEILVITTIAGLTGALFMASILNEVVKMPHVASLYAMDIRVVVVSIILIYGLNIVIGLLPIRSTIKRTPAEILSRNDVD